MYILYSLIVVSRMKCRRGIRVTRRSGGSRTVRDNLEFDVSKHLHRVCSLCVDQRVQATMYTGDSKANTWLPRLKKTQQR